MILKIGGLILLCYIFGITIGLLILIAYLIYQRYRNPGGI